MKNDKTPKHAAKPNRWIRPVAIGSLIALMAGIFWMSRTSPDLPLLDNTPTDRTEEIIRPEDRSDEPRDGSLQSAIDQGDQYFARLSR